MDFPKDYFDLVLPEPEELLRKRDVINNLTEFALKMQKEFGREISINQCRAAIYGAFDALPPAVTQPELYGFTLEYLILFALTCRKAGIENRDLKNFMMNTKLIYEVVRKDFEAQMKEAIAKIFKEDG